MYAWQIINHLFFGLKKSVKKYLHLKQEKPEQIGRKGRIKTSEACHRSFGHAFAEFFRTIDFMLFFLLLLCSTEFLNFACLRNS